MLVIMLLHYVSSMHNKIYCTLHQKDPVHKVSAQLIKQRL